MIETIETIKGIVYVKDLIYQLERFATRVRIVNDVYKTKDYNPIMNFIRLKKGIHWAARSLNIVTGCLYGCNYCYLPYLTGVYTNLDPSVRTLPHCWINHLNNPKNTPTNINPFPDLMRNRLVFVSSMGELFGEWVPDFLIQLVIDIIAGADPHWIFVFLTKNPVRLGDFKWPPNAWVGATVDCQRRVEITERSLERVNASVKFISLEPLLEQVTLYNPGNVDWIIIGSDNNSKHNVTKWDYVNDIIVQAKDNNKKVFCMDNLDLLSRPSNVRLYREYPEF